MLHERATVPARDFAAAERRAVDSYRGSKDSSLALYYLWRTGEAMTHHRDGFERVYARTEAIAPAHLITESSDADADRFMTRKAVAFAGIGRPGPLSGVLSRKVTKVEEQALERELVESGVLTEVVVGDVGCARSRAARSSCSPKIVDALDDVARGRVPKPWAPLDTTTDDEVVAAVTPRPGQRPRAGQGAVRRRLRVGDLQATGRRRVRALHHADPLGRPDRRPHRPQAQPSHRARS